MKEEMFSEYEIEEKKNIQQQIENYVHAQIYNKIFSKDNLEEDNDIYKTCEKNNMIKASDINKEINYDDEKMIQIMIYFVNNMENIMRKNKGNIMKKNKGNIMRKNKNNIMKKNKVNIMKKSINIRVKKAKDLMKEMVKKINKSYFK